MSVITVLLLEWGDDVDADTADRYGRRICRELEQTELYPVRAAAVHLALDDNDEPRVHRQPPASTSSWPWTHPTLSREEFDARVRQIQKEEASKPLAWWWLSFADPSLPEDEQFLGVAIVQARGGLNAIDQAAQLGINPGGEVAYQQLHDDHLPAVLLRNRLLSKHDLEQAGLISKEER
jgi:hypothetical protein